MVSNPKCGIELLENYQGLKKCVVPKKTSRCDVLKPLKTTAWKLPNKNWGQIPLFSRYMGSWILEIFYQVDLPVSSHPRLQCFSMNRSPRISDNYLKWRCWTLFSAILGVGFPLAEMFVDMILESMKIGGTSSKLWHVPNMFLCGSLNWWWQKIHAFFLKKKHIDFPWDTITSTSEKSQNIQQQIPGTITNTKLNQQLPWTTHHPPKKNKTCKQNNVFFCFFWPKKWWVLRVASGFLNF